MSDLGKAIYMAASVFLFIVAATTSIYVYSSLNSYLELMTKSAVNVTNRAEVTVADGTKETRKIGRSEIYITLFNMEQMNVEKLTVGGYTVDEENVSQKNGDYEALMYYLRNNPNKSFSYSYDADNRTVLYN